MGRNRKPFIEAFKKEVAIEVLKERRLVNRLSLDWYLIEKKSL